MSVVSPMLDVSMLPPEVQRQLKQFDYEYRDALTNSYLWALHGKSILEKTVIYLSQEMAKINLSLSAVPESEDPWEGEPN